MEAAARSNFQTTFSSDPQIVIKAPGRINVIGEHIDYHLGYVMPAAIDQAIYLALSTRSTGSSRFYSADLEEWYEADAEENPGWSDYVQTVFTIAKENELEVAPVEGVIIADLPVGAGLSSSAALCCGLIFGLDQLFGWNLDRVEMAEFGQAVEHRLGALVGLMDQYAVLHGKQDHVLKLDCQSNEHVYISVNLGHYEFVLLHSGVSHALVESAYNDRRAASEAGLAMIHAQYAQVKTYRDVSKEMVDRTHVLTQEQTDLAHYIIEEIDRVSEASTCLQEGETERLGKLLVKTHRGLQTKYRVTCDETDLLVDLLTAYPSVLGARQMGGGFGGCILILVAKDQRDVVLDAVRTDYLKKTGIDARLIPIMLSEGVRQLVSS